MNLLEYTKSVLGTETANKVLTNCVLFHYKDNRSIFEVVEFLNSIFYKDEYFVEEIYPKETRALDIFLAFYTPLKRKPDLYKLRDIIGRMFTWAETKEGMKFWNNLDKELSHKTYYEPMPK